MDLVASTGLDRKLRPPAFSMRTRSELHLVSCVTLCREVMCYGDWLCLAETAGGYMWSTARQQLKPRRATQGLQRPAQTTPQSL